MEMKKTPGILPKREPPGSVEYRIKEVNRYLSDENREKLRSIRRDDVDRDFKKHALKYEAIINPRKLQDMLAGMSRKAIAKRHNDRMRVAMGQAVDLGLLVKRLPKGPAQPPKQEGHEERAKLYKKKQQASSKRNAKHRETRIKIAMKICHWAAQLLDRDPDLSLIHI